MRLRAFMWHGSALFLGERISVPPHEHVAHQLAVSLEGPLKHPTGSGEMLIGRGFVVPSGIQHGLQSAPGGEYGIWAEPYSWEGRRLMERFPADRITVLDPVTADRIVAEIGCSQPFDEIRTPDEARDARDAFWRGLLGEARQRTFVDPRIRSALDFLFRERAKRTRVRDVAAHVGLSEGYFSRLFTEQVGVSPSRYRLWLRLLEATRELSAGASITDAAHSAGFSDAAHYARTYRRLSGATPSEIWQEHSDIEFIACGEKWRSSQS